MITSSTDLAAVNSILESLFGATKEKLLFGTSTDYYWSIDNPDVQADFLRVRERDGSVQITVKGKDRGTNINRMEREYSTTDPLGTVLGVTTAAFGPALGRVGKCYYVYWLDRQTTVCCYQITEPPVSDTESKGRGIIIEVESTNQNRVLELETKVVEEFNRRDIHIERAPGSLYEMFIANK